MHGRIQGLNRTWRTVTYVTKTMVKKMRLHVVATCCPYLPSIFGIYDMNIPTSNLGYLAKPAKCRVSFLGHGMSNIIENWCMGRSRRVMHGGKFFPTLKVRVKVTGVRNLSHMAPCQIDRLRQGQRKRREVSIL